MRFGCVAAAAVLMTAFPASADVIVPDGVKPLHGSPKAVLVSPPNGGGPTSIIYLHAHSVENPVLTVLNLTGGTPDAIIHFGGYKAPVAGQFDADGNFSLLKPKILSQGFSFNTSIRAYKGAKLTSFNLADLTITGTGISVPEPSTWLMMIMGFGAIGGAMRLRHRARNCLSHVGDHA